VHKLSLNRAVEQLLLDALCDRGYHMQKEATRG
jgi:hypothetical protein